MSDKRVKMIEMDMIRKWKRKQEPRGRPTGTRETLTVREKRFADRVLEGKSQTQAATEAYGYPLDGSRRSAASTIGSLNMKKERVIRYLSEQGHGAATRIVQMSKNAKNEAVKLNANKDILDRAQIGVKQGPTTAVQINFGADREEFGRA